MEIPNLKDIEEAFKDVYPNEKLTDVTYTPQEDRVVLTIHSEGVEQRGEDHITFKKTRTYECQPGANYKALFANTPTLVVD